MTNSKSNTDSLKLLSHNVRGLGNQTEILDWAIFACVLNKKHIQFFFRKQIQQRNVRVNRKKEWGPAIIYSYGSKTDARCAAVLIRNGLNIVIQKEE